MAFTVPSISDLLQQEHTADSFYNFPPGTMEALGNSETGNGSNLGSIGNIFQVTPSTAVKPGYGLSGVNGNDPMSVGAYLSALVNGPGGGSVASGLALYQGRPVGSTGNNAMNSFLGTIGSQGSDALNFVTGGIFGKASPANAGKSDTITSAVVRIAVLVLAIALIILGLAALALKSDPARLAVKAVKNIPVAP